MAEKSYNRESEQTLWQKFIAGDDKAYAYFYKEYVEALFCYGMKFTSDKELVKDCIQDVFVKLYSHRAGIGKVNEIRVYLFIALKNTLYTVFRKDKSMYHIDTIEPVFCVDYTAEDRIIADEQEQEERQRLARTLESLTPRQKEAIYYRYVEGMDMSSICRIMDINYQSALNLIQRSIQKAKSAFAGRSAEGKLRMVSKKQEGRYAE